MPVTNPRREFARAAASTRTEAEAMAKRCPECLGTGVSPNREATPCMCPVCHGTGRRMGGRVMANDKDGGPAFPRAPFTYSDVQELKWDVREQSGMSLRDYFAGQALAGLVNRASDGEVEDMFHKVKGGMIEAGAAYAWADAMLKVRKP